MANTNVNRIKVTRTIPTALPDPPKLASFIRRGVLTIAEAKLYDAENKRWFDRMQHVLKSQWFEEA